MLFTGRSEFASRLSLVLLKQDIELVAKVFELLLEISISFQRKLQLLREVADCVARLFELSTQLGIFLSKEVDFRTA